MIGADTTSPLLGMLLMGDGLHDDTWGDEANTNFQILENAIAGVTTLALTGGTQALTEVQVATGLLIITGALLENQLITVPPTTGKLLVYNQTTGAFSLIVSTADGTGSAVAQNTSELLFCDGTNVDSLSADTTPPGVVEEYYGILLPSTRWDWANGQAISRTANAALLAVLTLSIQGTIGGGATVLPVTTDITQLGLIGSVIEGIGIPSNTTITAATSTEITVSNATTGAAVQNPITIFPFGNGDGATTFNKPDRSERVAIGRGNMGGAADPGRVTTASIAGGPLNLNGNGGVEQVALTVPQMPSHTHTDSGHTHTIDDPGHDHTLELNLSSNSGSQTSYSGNGAYNAGTQYTTAPAATGITIVSGTANLEDTGGGEAHTNMQPFLICNYIIRLY